MLEIDMALDIISCACLQERPQACGLGAHLSSGWYYGIGLRIRSSLNATECVC